MAAANYTDCQRLQNYVRILPKDMKKETDRRSGANDSGYRQNITYGICTLFGKCVSCKTLFRPARLLRDFKSISNGVFRHYCRCDKQTRLHRSNFRQVRYQLTAISDIRMKTTLVGFWSCLHSTYLFARNLKMGCAPVLCEKILHLPTSNWCGFSICNTHDI